MNPYISDMLDQPNALQNALDRYAPADLGSLAAQVQRGSYDRVVLTGMGSSFFGAYPAWLQLINAGLPVLHIEASELLHYARGAVTDKTLLCMISQSGRSAEILALLERVHPAHLLAITNDAENPLASAAQTLVLMHAGVETNVSTKTYLNTLAVTHLTALQLAGLPLEPAQGELAAAVPAMRAYLEDWQTIVANYATAVGRPERLFYLGRGPSLATVFAGALTTKESTRFNVEGMSAGQYRHGPLELTDERLSVLILAGEAPTLELNRRLAYDLQGYGAHVTWIGPQPLVGVPSVLHPDVRGAALPIVEMLPFELLTLHLAATFGLEAGAFRHSGKITATE